MAFSVTNADTSALSPATVPGDFRDQFVRLAFDNSYPTGGLALTPAQVGLNVIAAVNLSGVTEAGRLAVPLRQSDGTYKIKVYVSSTGAEVANTTDLSADRVVGTIWGL